MKIHDLSIHNKPVKRFRFNIKSEFSVELSASNKEEAKQKIKDMISKGELDNELRYATILSRGVKLR